MASSAVLIGCGALGATVASLLVRAGIGRLRIIDRDFVEPSNLQRQTLFEESDAREALPKAVAAERRLRAANSSVTVDGVVADLTPANADKMLAGFPLMLDGTDNFETRFLVNDASAKFGVPWIYAAAVASYGLTMTVLPGQSACLACLLEASATQNISVTHNNTVSDNNTVTRGMEETCDTVGVLNAIVGVIGSIQAAEAIKILSGCEGALHGRLISCDVWSGRFQSIRVERNPDCRVCARREFAWLEGEQQPQVTMCGRNSVQIHERRKALDLGELGRRLAPAVAGVHANDFLLRFAVPPYEMTVFADGRAVIKGTRDPALARSLYARYIGA